MTQFYVYLLADPRDGTVFYVGKGQGYRAFVHLGRRAKQNGAVKARVAQIRAAGAEPSLEVKNVDTETEAFAVERALISLLGRMDRGTGTLLNRTAGGQGSSGRTGFRHTEETKARIRASTKGRPLTAEHRQRISAAAKGRPGPTPAQIAAMHAALRTPEGRKKLSEASKRSVTVEHLRRMTQRAAEVNRGRKLSPEQCAQRSVAAKGRTFSEAARANMSAGQRRRHAK